MSSATDHVCVSATDCSTLRPQLFLQMLYVFGHRSFICRSATDPVCVSAIDCSTLQPQLYLTCLKFSLTGKPTGLGGEHSRAEEKLPNLPRQYKCKDTKNTRTNKG